ncbi:MAG: DedA family protein [Bacteroidales bacterium]|nr:DedA family protein [Bacteroidales bacterium]
METLSGLGLVGLFLGSFLAATVVPFSSDALYVGVLIAGISPWTAFVVGTVGNWLGGLTSYWVGRVGKWEWMEKWFRVNRQTLENQKTKIDKWGPMLAFVSWVPIVGDVFAVALGFYKVDFLKSSVYMLLGKAARFAVWNLIYFCF